MKRIGIVAVSLLAAVNASAQQAIKPRPLGETQAASKELFGSATLARQLPNGSVIVNDALRRRLLLLDPTLQSYTVIADSAAGATNSYGPRPGALIPYVADSTLFLDVTSGSFIVIDPAGKVTRVMSPPRPQDNGAIASTATGFPGFDARGRMVYRTSYPMAPQMLRDGSIQAAPRPDSAPLIRVDLDTRRADTVATLRIPRMISSSVTLPNGGSFMSMTQAPLATVDDWALLSDGTIAIIRGRDYHIDWILPDGTRRSSDKVAFEWKRLSDEDKLALVDSITKARASAQTTAPGAGGGQVMSFGEGGGMRITMGGDGGGGRGAQMVTRDVISGPPPAAAPPAAAQTPPTSSTAGQARTDPKAAEAKPATSNNAAPAPANANANANAPASAERAVADRLAAVGVTPAMVGPAPLSASDLPDYMPPFMAVAGAASARADADANLWIRTTTPGAAPGNLVYDVVNNQGVVIDRIDVPKGMSIVGFGRGGIVYLTQRDALGVRLVKATIK